MRLGSAFRNVVALCALLATACATCITCSPSRGFLERSIVVHGRAYRYRVWLPRRYTRLRRWPVIVFLHGSGEVGSDDARQLTIGLPTMLAHDPGSYPAIVVIPQCPEGLEWYGAMESVVLAELDATAKDFRTDARRIYLTGISMGGAGVWYMARHPERFAAIVPVCGEVVRAPNDPFPYPPPPDLQKILDAPSPYDALAAAIGKTPVWEFHGADDSVISPEQSRRMFAALRARHANVRYTEVPGVGHGVWDIAYANPRLTQWLFAQRRTK